MTETIRANILNEYTVTNNEDEDVYHCQFTESDIKKLPNKWIPSKFGASASLRKSA